MNTLSALSILATLAYGVLGATALRLEPGGRTNRVFFLLCAAFGIWAFGFAFMYSATTQEACWAWDRVASLGWATFPALALHTSLLLAGQRRWTDRAWILALLYLPGVIILVRYQVLHLGTEISYERLPLGWTPDVGGLLPWFYFYEVYTAACVGTSLVVLGRWANRARRIAERPDFR